MIFLYIIQKLGDNIFFSFQVELNFLIKACLVLRLKNALKKIWNFFLLFYLFQINIFDVFVFFLIFFKYIEIGYGCAVTPKENILSWVLPQENPK